MVVNVEAAGSLFTQFGWKTLFAMVSVLYFEVLFISLIREQNLLKLSAFLFCFHEIKQVAQVDGICAGSCCCCYLPPSPSIVFPRKACIVKHDYLSDPHHTLFECLSRTKLLQNNISPCHQGSTYICFCSMIGIAVFLVLSCTVLTHQSHSSAFHFHCLL